MWLSGRKRHPAKVLGAQVPRRFKSCHLRACPAVRAERRGFSLPWRSWLLALTMPASRFGAWVPGSRFGAWVPGSRFGGGCRLVARLGFGRGEDGGWCFCRRGAFCDILKKFCGRSSSVEWKLPKLQRRVRLPSPAPLRHRFGYKAVAVLLTGTDVRFSLKSRGFLGFVVFAVRLGGGRLTALLGIIRSILVPTVGVVPGGGLTAGCRRHRHPRQQGWESIGG